MGSQTALPKIPVVDFSKQDLKPGTQPWLSTSKQVCAALEEYGCFIVECNDVSSDLHNKVFDGAKELFDLPIEAKEKNTSEYPFRGYVSPSNFYESLNIDDAGHLESTQKFTNLMWPDHGNARFCENVHKIASLMGRLNEMVIRMVFERYGVEKYSDSHIGSIEYLLRFSKYKQAKDHMALPIHTDNSFTTILYQDHVNGLEVQMKDESWTVYDPPSRSSFIYFAAEAFKAWSNNRIRPCVHRVLMNVNDERYTLALFAFQKDEIRVPDELVDDEHPLLYKPFNHLDYLMTHLKQIYSSKFKVDYPIEAHCGI